MNTIPTVAALLAHAQHLGVARLDAQLLLAHRLGQSRTWVIAHDDHALAEADVTTLEAALQQRAGGMPLAYLVGEREFHGLALEVSRDVLVPRPETELLVDWALKLLAAMRAADAPGPAPSPCAVVDLGTGSGAVALAIKQAAPWVSVTATDASTAALAVAQRNAQRHGLDVECVLGNWWQPLAGRQFALALSNPPYIAGGDPHLAALMHEPLAALTPGGDGLDALKRLVANAPHHLQRGGWLLLEHGFDQAEAVTALLRARGFAQVQTRRDLAGLPRCTGAYWPG